MQLNTKNTQRLGETIPKKRRCSGVTVSDLTSPRIEPQTSRTNVLTTKLTGWS